MATRRWHTERGYGSKCPGSEAGNFCLTGCTKKGGNGGFRDVTGRSGGIIKEQQYSKSLGNFTSYNKPFWGGL